MPRDEAPSRSASSDQDRALVAKAVAGDQSAYAALMGKYAKALKRHIARTVHSPRELDDLVQESFIKAFNALGSYSSGYAFSTWLYKIATNHAIDFLRKKRLTTVSLDKSTQPDGDPVQMEVPDAEYRPDRHIIRDQRRVLIQQAIDRLPPKYYRVIVLVHQEEKRYDEIAEELNLPLGTVKAHIHRGRKLLRAYLKGKREVLL